MQTSILYNHTVSSAGHDYFSPPIFTQLAAAVAEEKFNLTIYFLTTQLTRKIANIGILFLRPLRWSILPGQYLIEETSCR
ncbi:DNA mismatch repair protein [Shewanella benthica KT99]|uniref:DNA mismatch repair protein n=1 Tax=Shewanella benthica KT99 TaxID=314608 RepID=A9D5P2_9GAMM|nr:DNA mismatch repair protein [Shewanella benthica KT99]